MERGINTDFEVIWTNPCFIGVLSVAELVSPQLDLPSTSNGAG